MENKITNESFFEKFANATVKKIGNASKVAAVVGLAFAASGLSNTVVAATQEDINSYQNNATIYEQVEENQSFESIMDTKERFNNSYTKQEQSNILKISMFIGERKNDAPSNLTEAMDYFENAYYNHINKIGSQPSMYGEHHFISNVLDSYPEINEQEVPFFLERSIDSPYPDYQELTQEQKDMFSVKAESLTESQSLKAKPYSNAEEAHEFVQSYLNHGIRINGGVWAFDSNTGDYDMLMDKETLNKNTNKFIKEGFSPEKVENLPESLKIKKSFDLDKLESAALFDISNEIENSNKQSSPTFPDYSKSLPKGPKDHKIG